ncbi:sensor histidine kinase [Lentzea sp. JNUCC 0626]|uniref:sensor histidine kinase n=1 Tax=Lentzea sp. JNUCC 0626 TaxID=3367513 RepID=UPI0037479483
MPELLLRLGSRSWRHLLAAVVGVALWCAQTAVVLSGTLTPAQQDVVGAALVLDFAVGVAALAVLPLRRRHPLLAACLTGAACTVSVASMGPAALAVASLATRRRREPLVVAASVFLAGAVVSEFLYRPGFLFTEGSGFEPASSVVLSAVFFAAAVATGRYAATRRALVRSLSERALTAEREQALTARVARDAERNRIAREMHDVLAHRISMVTLHAGALSYRDDLDRAQTAEVAHTIQENARLALAELREVLGVLRSGGAADASPEPPQPTLAQLPALLADAREAGSTVRFDGGEVPGLPETLSRTAFRIVQEALTNARRHAPGEPVVVRLAGIADDVLEVEISNPLGPGPGTASAPGVGLLGLAERAELAGGTLVHGPRPDGSFAVTARLPWQS